MADNQLASDPAADPADPAIAASVDPVVAAVDPAATAADPAPAGADPALDPAAAVDPAAEPQGEPRPHGNKGQTPWYMRRINEETNKRQSVEEEKAQIARERDEYRALIERLQASGTEPKPGDPAQPRAAATAQPPDFQTAVRSEAQKLSAAQRLFEDTTAVKNAGVTAFPDFNESLGTLTAVGATADDFVLDVLAVDKANAHVIFDKLAKDPEKAARLAEMDSRHRIAELTRMVPMADAPKPAAAAAAIPKPISRAPAPRPAMEPVAAPAAVDWNDPNISDDAFSRAWDNKYKRSA